MMIQHLADLRTFDLADPQVFHALNNPENYDWSLPDEYETAVFNALETGEGFVSVDRNRLFAVAMSQPEPIRITMCGTGWRATRPI
jgi:hypothetical protein